MSEAFAERGEDRHAGHDDLRAYYCHAFICFDSTSQAGALCVCATLTASGASKQSFTISDVLAQLSFDRR